MGFIAMLVGFLAIYLAAEAVLAANPHPYHWIAAGAGAALSGVGAYAYVLWRHRRG